jgi:hypothetical protein
MVTKMRRVKGFRGADAGAWRAALSVQVAVAVADNVAVPVDVNAHDAQE